MNLKIDDTILLPIGIYRQDYWIKQDRIVEQIHFGNRTFFSKYRHVNKELTDDIIIKHLQGKITVAHSLISPDKHIENIIIDYNGDSAKKFYHHLKRELNSSNIKNIIAYQSKTVNHLHVYLNYDAMPLQDGIQLGKIISKKLSDKLPEQWRIYPNDNLPEAYNILNLPYDDHL